MSRLGFTPREIEYICSVYDSKPKTINGLQEKWPDRPRWHFTRVAQRAGLSRFGPRRWTESETTFLVTERWRFSPGEMAERLERSECAVRLKLKRLGFCWVLRINGFFTAMAVGDLFGVDSKAVAWWADNNWLIGNRFSTRIGPYQPRRFSYEAILNFIGDDQYWHLWEPVRMKPGNLREWAEKSRSGKGRFLTTGQLGRLAFYTHEWIRELIARGIIKARKCGYNWKIPEEEANKFIASYSCGGDID